MISVVRAMRFELDESFQSSCPLILFTKLFYIGENLYSWSARTFHCFRPVDLLSPSYCMALCEGYAMLCYSMLCDAMQCNAMRKTGTVQCRKEGTRSTAWPATEISCIALDNHTAGDGKLPHLQYSPERASRPIY